MKILLLTHRLENYADLSAITDKTRADYCAYQRSLGRDYTFRPVVGDQQPGVSLGFQKIKLIRDALEGPDAPEVVVWQATDTLILNPIVTIENIIGGRWAEWYDFYITYDCHGLNADSFIVRNTDWSKRWLDFLLSLEPRYRSDEWFEQRAMQDHWQREEWLHKILVLPQGVMNAYWYPLYPPWNDKTPGQLQHGDFVLHLPGLSKERRLEIVQSDALKRYFVLPAWVPPPLAALTIST